MQPHDEGLRTEDLANRPGEDEIRLEDEGGATRSEQAGEQIRLDRKDEAADQASEDADILLVAEDERRAFLERWKEIQAGFVDAPRNAVQEADGLVAEVMQHLARTFADARSGLEAQWDQEEDVSTEDLRVALQRYRGFFNRLLTA